MSASPRDSLSASTVQRYQSGGSLVNTTKIYLLVLPSTFLATICLSVCLHMRRILRLF